MAEGKSVTAKNRKKNKSKKNMSVFSPQLHQTLMYVEHSSSYLDTVCTKVEWASLYFICIHELVVFLSLSSLYYTSTFPMDI